MTRSKPYDLSFKCKCQWEQERFGEEYMITGRDLKEAKELLDASGTMPSNDSSVGHVKQFCKSDFGGWKTLNYPLWALFRNWNTYNPPFVKEKREIIIGCSMCGQEHGMNEDCKETVNT